MKATKSQSPTAQYIQSHVHGRCGQAVSRLAEAGLLPTPQLLTSEIEIHEWWLVSPELADKLRRARQAVVEFGELKMWGRGAAGTPLVDDLDLLDAIARPG